MKGITYNNTKTAIPGWVSNLHLEQSKGYAYETDLHFVHFYGRSTGFQIISVGLTTIEKKVGLLEDWVKRIFGAEDIESLNVEVGNTIEGVWRPSLYYYEDTYQALNCSQVEMRLAEQSLRLLIDKLDEIFLYVEPAKQCLDVYSHKIRELLILACTEVENSWLSYMTKTASKPINGKTFTTKDYIKLVDKLFLKEYQFKLRSYNDLPPVSPFNNWNTMAPTSSLTWYDAYNKTKHDRTSYFASATLWDCINAVVANLVMHCVKFSPFPMFEQSDVFSSLVKQHFTAELTNCSSTSFYLPRISFPDNIRNDLFVFDPRKSGYTKPYNVTPLLL
jgi:hypothetical protein